MPSDGTRIEFAPKLQGAQGRLFADPQPKAGEVSFQIDNTSVHYYDSKYYKLHKNDLLAIPPPSTPEPSLDLADVLPADMLASISTAKKLVFHAVGDTGAAKVDHFQTAAKAIAHEASVADAMTADVKRGGSTAPAFFYHLGDVVYYFGEAQYYYDQFYEPFRGYDRPIFAIPGNHDGSVYNQTMTSLDAFRRNFCAAQPGPASDAGAIVRSTMTQPGVYFTLDAPFVSIVGLYTNVLEWPGVISSQGGKYPTVGDAQLAFLEAELQRLAPARKSLERAVIVACHHPPSSVDDAHGGSAGLAADIDTAARGAGFWPDAVLSGHAHLYQRFTRAVDGREIPYVVAGSGGFAATAPQKALPPAPITKGEYTLVKNPIVDFGYLTVTLDWTRKPKLRIAFHDRTQTKVHDSLSLDLASGKVA